MTVAYVLSTGTMIDDLELLAYKFEFSENFAAFWCILRVFYAAN